MNIIDFLKGIINFIPNKISLYRRESEERKNFAKYGKLTNYWIKGENINIGEYTYGIPKILHFSGSIELEIGRFCCISDDVKFIFGGQHHYEHISQYALIPQMQKVFDNVDYEDKPSKPIKIGNDVWIGYNVTILNGVTIGDGAVLGTNTTIAKDIPPYSIVIGNPAIIIKYRFSEVQINALERIKWWNWDIEKIKRNLPLIMSENVEKFISKFDTI